MIEGLGFRVRIGRPHSSFRTEVKIIRVQV